MRPGRGTFVGHTETGDAPAPTRPAPRPRRLSGEYWAGNVAGNLEVVRSIREAFRRRLQRGRVGAPRHRVRGRRRTVTGQLEGARGHGRGMARLAERRWDDFSQQVDEYRDLDDEKVLVFFRCSGRGKTSGMDLAEVHPLMAGVFHASGRQGDEAIRRLPRPRARPREPSGSRTRRCPGVAQRQARPRLALGVRGGALTGRATPRAGQAFSRARPYSRPPKTDGRGRRPKWQTTSQRGPAGSHSRA